ncbi:hypothetical protein [Priestia megaterium]|uniref:hypothetical protein n=1 Tax=Priestia megaterium TaxID=1404 RepID=UPI0010CD5EEE|nr:hypothetical protein [Priestia megaterium]QCR30482.1 hypothetical protein C1N54_26965 [Priestia megaterium]
MALLDVIEISGKDKNNELVSFSYCGITMGLTYIQPFVRTNLIVDDLIVNRKDVISEEQLPNYIDNCNADLLIVATDKDTLLPLQKSNQFIMPFRIHQMVETYKGWEYVLDTMSKREVSRAKKQAKKYNLDYFITHEESDYFNFYDTMHKPTMNNRFEGLARSVEKYKALDEIFKQGLLFFVTHEGVPVSGSVSQIDKEKNWLNARLIGVLNGDSKYRNMGAQNFVYHSILHWACHEGGIDVVNFQGCEPFLTKGTFQYKKRFGTNAILPPNQLYNQRLLVQANFESRPVREFLINNPVMLVDEDNNLGAGYFYDHDNEPRLDIPYKCNGFKYEKLFDMDLVTVKS